MNDFSNFGWKFIKGFKDEYKTGDIRDGELVDIPHAPVEVPVSYFDEKDYQGIFTYAKEFKIDRIKDNEVAILTFEAIMVKARVYVNGVDYGEHVSGWVPLSLEIQKDLKEGENNIVVVVDSKEDENIPPFGGSIDYLTFAGIYRPVHLEVIPKTYFKNAYIHADSKGKIKISQEIVNPTKRDSINYQIFDGEKLVKSTKDAEFGIEKPHLWDTNDPHLYRLIIELNSENGHYEKEIKFGFRDVKFTEHGFFLNGQKLKLLGLNRHQNYPYVGPSLPKSAQEDDANIIKFDFGCNVVRTSHYPQSEDFLNRCDEIGLLVLDEIPGWQFVSKKASWRNNYYFFLREMILKERNHPSVISYGTRIDESDDDHDLYSKGYEIAHTLDPYRQTLGVRNYKTSECIEDIYAFNDFSGNSIYHGLDDPKSVKGGKGKPKLVTENNGHMFSTKYFDHADRRKENALRHLRVINDAYKYDDICGELGWCAFDYNTHKAFGSNDHICHHGVANIFRNPKESAYAFASQRDDKIVMEVINPPYVGDYSENLLHPLIVLTNCDYVELFKNGEFVKRFYPNKKDWLNLPHAPIYIDDFIGERFNEPQIKENIRGKIKDLLNIAATRGMASFTIKDYIKYGPAFLKSKMSMPEMGFLMGKYFSGQGLDVPNIWQVKGFKNDKEVTWKEFAPATKFHYAYKVSNNVLENKETYDVARVAISFLDEYENEAHYSQNVINFETAGPIEVIGPKQIAIIGDTSVYVRSKETKSPQKATLKIKTSLGVDTIEFGVK